LKSDGYLLYRVAGTTTDWSKEFFGFSVGNFGFLCQLSG
jgi:hypothetical protein